MTTSLDNFRASFKTLAALFGTCVFAGSLVAVTHSLAERVGVLEKRERDSHAALARIEENVKLLVARQNQK